jgi:hypothetical protein
MPTAVKVDTSLEKTTQIRERFSLLFRAEMFNATNHVVFPGRPRASHRPPSGKSF